ncbi:beta-N-acetylhexosaminidase [Shimazuella kribbensis]|uniref:beta-N-acetylhexosaminidase n=1 Tax=Shimazuella kribbensis TaxID=139808 RepID=UPI001FDF994B|nr:beta-N-acetylhexosaminidase [Shimazuella kribbensis]
MAASLLLMAIIASCSNQTKAPQEQTSQNNQQNDKPQEPNHVITEQAQKKLDSMTLDEKLGSMIIAGVEGTTPTEKTKSMIQNQHVGGIIFYKNNVESQEQLVSYVNELKTWNQQNPSPLFISIDEEGGKVSRLPGIEKIPTAKSIGKTGDLTYANNIGTYLGIASKSMGINMDYAPVLDINSNPNNPVIGNRSYGNTYQKVSDVGRAVMKGIQSAGTIPVIKHFPGHGDTSVDSHLDLPVVHKSLEQLQSFEWKPFEDAIREGADSVMIAHILFPKIDSKYPASLSPAIITDQLRNTIGFQGVVMTDDLTMGAISKNYGMGRAAVQAVQAGSDILLVAHGYDNVNNILSALKKNITNGKLTKKRIDESVLRILMLKEKYKLSDEGKVQTPDLTKLNEEIRKEITKH